MTNEIIQTVLSMLMTGMEQETVIEPGTYKAWNERLRKELEECELICFHAGLRTGKVTDIRVNPGLKYAWGRCITNRIEGTHEIEINKVLMSGSVPDLSLKKTIIHELCHTVRDGHGHEKGWLDAADRLKQVYGLQLSSENSPEDLSVTEHLEQPPAGFVIGCIVCGTDGESISNFPQV